MQGGKPTDLAITDSSWRALERCAISILSVHTISQTLKYHVLSALIPLLILAKSLSGGFLMENFSFDQFSLALAHKVDGHF